VKIAMVSEHASPLAPLGGADAGGQNVHVAELSSALAAQGHEVVVHTRRIGPAQPHRQPFRPGVTVQHDDAGPAEPLPRDELYRHMGEFGRCLGTSWRADPPDVVHAHFWMSGLASLLALRDLPEIPSVQTYHALGVVKQRHQGSHDTSPPTRIDVERSIGRRVDRVIATCADEVSELVAMGVPRRRICVVPCGVDTHALHPDELLGAPEAPSRAARHRLVALGRLVPRKGVDDVVRALTGVPDAELLIAGGPPADELAGDPDAHRLRELARTCGVADRVRLLGGVPRDRVGPLLRSADAVVCVPWYEPFGIVPLEAMACGVPVVAAEVGGLADTVLDGITGLHVPPRDPTTLARALTGLLTDPVRRLAMGVAGRDRAVARYGWPKVAQESARVYGRLLAARLVPGGTAPDTRASEAVSGARASDAVSGGVGGAR
jgi:glycosyltransferase involved in cell wall biosynthesis